MAFVNQNYCNLKESYLFSQIAHKVAEFTAAHPEKKIIKMRNLAAGSCRY